MVRVNTGKFIVNYYFYYYRHYYYHCAMTVDWCIDLLNVLLYRCSGKSGQILSPVLLFCLIAATLFIMSFCYVRILWELNRILTISKPTKQKRAAKKIVSYVLVFVVHWIPILVQNFGRLLGVRFLVYFDLFWFFFFKCD